MEKFEPLNQPRKIIIRNQEALSALNQANVRDYLQNIAHQDSFDTPLGSKPIEESLGPEAEGRIIATYDIAEKVFKEKGFSGELRLSPLAIVESHVDKNHFGVSKYEVIEIVDTLIPNRQLKQIQFLKTLGHELYHSTASLSADVVHSKQDDTLYISLNNGASYRDPVNPERIDDLLEEGLAYQFQERVLQKSLLLFNDKDQKNYRSIIEEKQESFAAIIGTSRELIDPAGIAIYSSKIDEPDQPGKLFAEYYKDASHAKRFADYLSEEVPDFDRLVEDARIERKTLPLARAIEARFGSGSYREITTARMDDGEALLKKLKQA